MWSCVQSAHQQQWWKLQENTTGEIISPVVFSHGIRSRSDRTPLASPRLPVANNGELHPMQLMWLYQIVDFIFGSSSDAAQNQLLYDKEPEFFLKEFSGAAARFPLRWCMDFPIPEKQFQQPVRCPGLGRFPWRQQEKVRAFPFLHPRDKHCCLDSRERFTIFAPGKIFDGPCSLPPSWSADSFLFEQGVLGCVAINLWETLR